MTHTPPGGSSSCAVPYVRTWRVWALCPSPAIGPNTVSHCPWWFAKIIVRMLLLSLEVGRGIPKLDLEGCVGAFQLVGKIGEEEVRAGKEAVIRLRRSDSVVVASPVSEATEVSPPHPSTILAPSHPPWGPFSWKK